MHDDDATANGDREGPGADDHPFLSEWDGSTRPGVAIVEAVAAATGRDPLELPPLEASIDSDALNAFVLSGTSKSANGVRVTFDYADTEVSMDGGGRIVVRAVESDGA